MDTMDKVQGAHSDWTMSMDSVDIVPCFAEQSPWTPSPMSMDLVESLDNVHGYSGQSPESPLRLDNVHGLSGQYPLSPWRMSMDSRTGECPWTPGHYPRTRWKVWTKCGHCPLIPWIVSRQTGQCPLNSWAPWTFSMDKVHSLS